MTEASMTTAIGVAVTRRNNRVIDSSVERNKVTTIMAKRAVQMEEMMAGKDGRVTLES